MRANWVRNGLYLFGFGVFFQLITIPLGNSGYELTSKFPPPLLIVLGLIIAGIGAVLPKKS